MAGEEENVPSTLPEETVPSTSPEETRAEDDDQPVVIEKSDDATVSQEQHISERAIKLPLSRIKVIMKSDPDVTLASSEAVVALAKATEIFIQHISKDAVNSTLQSKRKTLQRKDLDNVLDTRDAYSFLEGALD